ncbi:MFS transporter [Streptomyces sp. NPDC088246]|uniref:MFS transporter n=1 Tax=Streptomyces sp. NPDC088246 TaxID=3365842 RepID=UPI00381458F8
MPESMPVLSPRRRLVVLAICCASVIVVVMDISIVNVALPSIRRDLRASVSGLQWTVDAYTLVLASFSVLAGSTADRVGRRRILQVGLAAFGLGSLLCGLAPSIGWLIAARARPAQTRRPRGTDAVRDGMRRHRDPPHDRAPDRSRQP